MTSRLPPFMMNLDIFGVKPHLYFQGKAHSATRFGLCLTFLFVFFTLLCFFYFGQDIYFRRNPAIVYNEEYQGLPDKFILDPELMPILVEINSPYADEYYTDPTVVKAKVAQFTIDKTAEVPFTLVEYDMEICRPDHLDKTDEITRSHFLKFNLKDFFCIPKNLKNLTVQGAFDQQIYQAIKVSFQICDNSTSEIICKSSDYIKNKINRGFIGFYFKDLTVNPGVYDETSSSSPRQVFTNFVLNSQKEIDVFFKNNYIVTDDGVLVEEKTEDKIVNFDNNVEFNFMQENPEFLMVYLRLAQKRTFYKRRYAKIQNLIAQVGGFINCFWLLAMAINFLHAHLIFIRDIVLEIFSIKFMKIETLTYRKTKLSMIQPSKAKESNESDQRSQISVNPSTLLKKDNFVSSETFEKKISINSLQKIITTKENEEKDEKKNSITELKLGFMDFLNFYFGWFKTPEREQRKAIIKKGMNILRNNLDVKFLIQKFYEIEKLKFLLLNEEQLKLFDKLPKPELELIVKRNNFDVVTKFMTRRISKDENDFVVKRPGKK